MESSVSPKDEIWFLHVCHHISTGLYNRLTLWKRDCAGTRKLSSSSEIQTKVEKWSLEVGTANVCTGFSWHTLLSDGRIVLITFSRQLILKYLRAGNDQYLQHPYQCFLHYHHFLTRHRQYMIHPSNSNTKSSKRCNRFLPDLHESMPMTICSSHSTLITFAFEKVLLRNLIIRKSITAQILLRMSVH